MGATDFREVKAIAATRATPHDLFRTWPPITYSETNRIGDHMCYYSNLSKLQSHYPDWKLTFTLGQIVDEMLQVATTYNRPRR